MLACIEKEEAGDGQGDAEEPRWCLQGEGCIGSLERGEDDGAAIQ